MADNTTPEGLLQRLGVTPDTTESRLVDELYKDATASVLDFTHRDKLVGNMAVYAKQLTVVAYNRLDTEGESQRNEGNINRYFVTDIPEEIQKPLKRYRLAILRGMQ